MEAVFAAYRKEKEKGTVKLNEPHISVIIPMYNLEKYIKEAITSVLANDYKNFELVCVDDGSTDNTAEVCRELAQTNSEIKLIRTENKGVSSARNTGLKNAAGKYVVFMDGDDMLKDGALKAIAENTADDCDILIFAAEIIGDTKELPPDFITGSRCGSGEFEYSASVLFEKDGVFPFIWNKAFRRRFLLDNYLEFDADLRLGEDQVFLLTSFPAAKKIRFISEELYIYRFKRPESASTALGNDDYIRCSCHLDDLEKAAELWKRNGYYNGAERQFCEWCGDFAVNSVLMVKSHKMAAEFAMKLSGIIDKYEIPYGNAGLKIYLKYRIIKSRLLLKLFFIYRIFRWHI